MLDVSSFSTSSSPAAQLESSSSYEGFLARDSGIGSEIYRGEKISDGDESPLSSTSNARSTLVIDT